jgi:hypothetical protein
MCEAGKTNGARDMKEGIRRQQETRWASNLVWREPAIFTVSIACCTSSSMFETLAVTCIVEEGREAALGSGGCGIQTTNSIQRFPA